MRSAAPDCQPAFIVPRSRTTYRNSTAYSLRRRGEDLCQNQVVEILALRSGFAPRMILWNCLFVRTIDPGDDSRHAAGPLPVTEI